MGQTKFYSDKDRFGHRIVRPITSALGTSARFPKTKIVNFKNREQAQRHLESLSDSETEEHLVHEHGVKEESLFFKQNPGSKGPSPVRESVLAKHRRLHGFSRAAPSPVGSTEDSIRQSHVIQDRIQADREKEHKLEEDKQRQFWRNVGKQAERAENLGGKEII